MGTDLENTYTCFVNTGLFCAFITACKDIQIYFIVVQLNNCCKPLMFKVHLISRFSNYCDFRKIKWTRICMSQYLYHYKLFKTQNEMGL